MTNHIPIISLENVTTDSERDLLLSKSKEIVEALSSVGFVYLKDLAITAKMVDDSFLRAQEFFGLPDVEKLKYDVLCQPNSPNVGYVPMERERFYTDRPADKKEAFDYCSSVSIKEMETLPEKFHENLKFMNEKLKELSQLLLYLIGLGLNIKDPKHFCEATMNGDGLTFRTLHYPQIDSYSGIEPGEMRCQEHTDYGFLAILFQDSIGGLEVKNPEGEFVEATPIPSTALINIGDILEMCTSGRLKSTTHRVMITKGNFNMRRQSMVLFCDPDGSYDITIVDGNSKSPGMTFNEWRNKRYNETGILTSD